VVDQDVIGRSVCCILSRECGGCHDLAFVGVIVDLGESAFGVDVDSEVAATFGPLVLFGQDGADEADEGGLVGAPLSSSSDGFR
jgi:hypothetical protein